MAEFFVIRILRSIAYRLNHSLSGMPWVIMVLLFLALILIVVIVILTVIGMRKAAKKAPKAATVDLDQEDVSNDKLPPRWGWISEFLSRRGFFHVSFLSLSFLRALEFLRKTLDTYNYKYQLPWYLLIGAQNSGKTTILENTELNLPLGKQDLGIHRTKPECGWWFLNRGVILDVRGDFLLLQDNVGSNEKGWRSLLILLTRYRTARPINGIILTIPATELYGHQRLSVDQVNSRAEYIAHKLATTQNSIGLRLPIYVLITKTDVVPGFQSFCSEIPTRNRHDMLGWASPYNLNTAYTSGWVEEAFSSISENLHELQIEIFSESRLSTVRDGVFVFPNELSTLKDHLIIYLNHIFKSNAYQQSMALRGIYFCGDSGLTPFKLMDGEETSSEDLAVVSKPETLIPGQNNEESHLELMALSGEKNQRKPFFVKDLINKKILQESGIANPQPQRVLSINRMLNLARIATAIFIILGSHGLYNAYDNFVRSRDYMMPVLGKMNSLLADLRNLKLDQPVHSNELFDVYARELIEMMEQLQQTEFFSIFVPASWFSPLYDDLQNTLKVSYQHVVLRTIYIDLLLKAKELLHLRPSLQDQSQTVTQLLNPLSCPEYLLLRRYIEGLTTLQDKIDKFNNLKEMATYRDLSDLVVYTFGGQLPKQFAEQYHRFQALLSNTVFPPIDLKPYQALARETLNVLYQNFLNILFNPAQPNSLPNRLNFVLEQLSQQGSQNLPDINVLRQFSLDLSQAMAALGEPGQTWLDKDYFNPHKDFDILLDKVDASSLFGKELTQYLVDQTAVGFMNLKEQLKPINQLLSDHPLSSLSSPVLGQNYHPSQGLIALLKSLTKLFAEPYMGMPSGRTFVTVAPPGKIIYWDSKLIQLAYDMAKRFDEFATKEISTFPPILHENLKLLARQNLQANIVDLVARSQSFIDLPTNLSQGLAAEEVLRSKIADVCDVAPKFAKLLEILNQDTVGFAFIELRDLLSTTGYWLLSQVEIMLQNLTPYAIQDVTFNWWNGQAGASLVGYSAQDIEDLKTYLQLQHQQIQTMALNYAKPLVTFLSVPVMIEAAGDKTLLNRWRRIVEQVEAYNKKQPGNSVGILESFILKDLNSYTLKSIFSEVSLKDIQQPSGDYFLELVRQLKKAALGRAEVMRRQQSIRNYEELVSFFNKYLKNKFPFVGNNLTLTMAEADPEDVRTFFKKYDAFGGSAKEIINQVYQLGSVAEPAVEFLNQLQAVKEFFPNFLKDQGADDLPSFDFSIDFRVNRGREIGGDMIVDWTLKPDEDTSIHKSDKSRSGHWVYGNPVVLGFRWPQGDSVPIKPVKDPAQPLLSIDEKTATFSFSNKWSFLWMLRLHMANKSEYSAIQDPDPQVIKFTIPLVGSGKAIVYNLITLTLPSDNPKKTGKTVRMPVFPFEAPDLPEEILLYADEPVLAEGEVEAVELKDPSEEAAAASRAKVDAKDEKKDKKDDEKDKKAEPAADTKKKP